MWMTGAENAVVAKHFRVCPVIRVFVVAGQLRLEGGSAAPSHLRHKCLRFGRPPIVFVYESSAILVDAHSSSQVAQMATGEVRTCIVASTRAKQFSPVQIVVSCVEIVGAEPSVARSCWLRIDTMAAF